MGIIGWILFRGIVALAGGVVIVATSVMIGCMTYDYSAVVTEMNGWAERRSLFAGTAAYLVIIWVILWLNGKMKPMLHQVLTFILMPLMTIMGMVTGVIPIDPSFAILVLIAALAVYKGMLREVGVQRQTA